MRQEKNSWRQQIAVTNKEAMQKSTSVHCVLIHIMVYYVYIFKYNVVDNCTLCITYCTIIIVKVLNFCLRTAVYLCVVLILLRSRQPSSIPLIDTERRVFDAGIICPAFCSGCTYKHNYMFFFYKSQPSSQTNRLDIRLHTLWLGRFASK